MLFVLLLAKRTPPTVTDYIVCEYTRELNRPVREGEENWVKVQYVEICPAFMMCAEKQMSAINVNERDYTMRTCPESMPMRQTNAFVHNSADPDYQEYLPAACNTEGSYVFLREQFGIKYAKYDNESWYTEDYSSGLWYRSGDSFKSDLTVSLWDGANVAYCDWSKFPDSSYNDNGINIKFV